METNKEVSIHRAGLAMCIDVQNSTGLNRGGSGVGFGEGAVALVPPPQKKSFRSVSELVASL